MAQDTSTKVVLALVIILAIVGVIFLMRGGDYSYKSASRERPGQIGYSGECCTCSRTLTTVRGAILPETREVLFRNEVVPDCSTACAEAHEYTKQGNTKYALSAVVSGADACRASLPNPRAYAGAGGFNDQPTQDKYYIS